jgi:hypothetical protein
VVAFGIDRGLCLLGQLSEALGLLEHPPALAVCALPLRVLHLDPPAARPAGVARLPPLRHDAFEPEAVAVVEQDLGVREHLDLVEVGHPRAAAKLILSCSDLRVSVRQQPAYSPCPSLAPHFRALGSLIGLVALVRPQIMFYGSRTTPNEKKIRLIRGAGVVLLAAALIYLGIKLAVT